MLYVNASRSGTTSVWTDVLSGSNNRCRVRASPPDLLIRVTVFQIGWPHQAARSYLSDRFRLLNFAASRRRCLLHPFSQIRSPFIIARMGYQVGLIAGQGRLPVLTAEGIRASGGSVACVGLSGQFDPALPPMCDRFSKAGIIRIGRWIRLLRRWGVHEAIMVGGVSKARMFQPLRVVRQLPDWRAAKLWYRVLRHDRRNDALLGAVADELASAGITLIDSTRYVTEHLADEGAMTRRKPSVSQAADIEFALPLARRLGDLDIGQSIVVRDREIIAVEAIEGTDALIVRAGELCPSGKWTLLKVAKPTQDTRFDVPTVGLKTIERLDAAGASCLAVEAGKVILLDKPQLIEAAESAGIAVVGVR